MTASLYLIALMLPLFAAFAAALSVRREASVAHPLLILSGLVGLSATGLFFASVAHGGASAVPVFGAALMSFIVTPLSAFFLGLVFLGELLTSWYALGYLPRYRTTYALPWLDFATGLFVAGMTATLMAGQPFTFLMAWEVMSVSAYFLIIADGSEDSLAAGFRYLFMAQVGFLCLLSGFLLLAHGNAFATWADVASTAATLSPFVRSAAFVLLFAGFGSKAGLVPLHQWLPAAHPQAPSPSSALLSGVMLKVALYGFLLSLGLFAYVPFWWAAFVVAVGLVSAFFGALHAVVEHDLKRMLAWSSIENMGLLFAGVGLFFLAHFLPGAALRSLLLASLAGFVALHALNHSLFKTGLFMAAGAVATETHTRDLDRLGGLARAWPVFSGVFLALALAAAALPPTGTFFGEWLLLESLALGLTSGAPLFSIAFALMLAAFALVGGLALFAFVRLVSVTMLGRARSPAAEHVGAMPRALMLPPAVSAVLVGISGLFAFPLLAHPGQVPFSAFLHTTVVAPGASMNAWLVFAALAVAVALPLLFRKSVARTTERETDTWDCGAPITARMQYTATGFAAPLRFFFRSFVLARRELRAEPVVATNPWITRKRLSWTTDSFWEVSLYRPVGKAAFALAGMARKLQNGVVQSYLLLVFAALVAVIIVAL